MNINFDMQVDPFVQLMNTKYDETLATCSIAIYNPSLLTLLYFYV